MADMQTGHDFWPLIEVAGNLGQFTGYLDTAGLKQKAVAEQAYRTCRDKLSYELIRDMHGWAAARNEAQARLDEIVAEQDEYWAQVVLRVKQDLVSRIEQDGARSPVRRWLTYYALPIVIGLGVVGYGAVWWYNDITIDHPLQTRAGLVQRAQAYAKLRRFEELQGGRSSLIKGVLIEPFKPDEEEIAAAQEFLDATIGGYAFLHGKGLACGPRVPQAGQMLEEDDFAMIDATSDYLRSSSVDWQSMPVGRTALVYLQKNYPCQKDPAL